MQWNAGHNAGFSEADPWLPVNPDYKLINVSEQDERQSSVLNFYRQLIALRKNPDYRETLVWGEFDPVYEDRKGLLAYYRRSDRTLLVLANLKSEPENIDSDREYKVLLDSMDPTDKYTDKTQQQTQRGVKLQAWQGMILEIMPD